MGIRAAVHRTHLGVGRLSANLKAKTDAIIEWRAADARSVAALFALMCGQTLMRLLALGCIL